MQQGRLSKFREQGMAVKTNQEFHAIQHEIAFAQTEIKKLEDTMLERMIEADDLTAALKSAETQLAAETKAIDAERKAAAPRTSRCRRRSSGSRPSAQHWSAASTGRC